MIKKRPEIFVKEAIRAKKEHLVPALRAAFKEGCRLRLQAITK